MSNRTIEVIMKELEQTLDKIPKRIPFDKELYLLYHIFFKQFEDSPLITEYLIKNKDVTIEEIQNTKMIFHEAIHDYIVRLAKNYPAIDKTGVRTEVNQLSDRYLELAKYEGEVLRLPTIEELRDPSLVEKKLQESLKNAKTN